MREILLRGGYEPVPFAEIDRTLATPSVDRGRSRFTETCRSTRRAVEVVNVRCPQMGDEVAKTTLAVTMLIILWSRVQVPHALPFGDGPTRQILVMGRRRPSLISGGGAHREWISKKAVFHTSQINVSCQLAFANFMSNGNTDERFVITCRCTGLVRRVWESSTKRCHADAYDACSGRASRQANLSVRKIRIGPWAGGS